MTEVLRIEVFKAKEFLFPFIISFKSFAFKSKRKQMMEDYFYEMEDISSTGLTLQQILEYYRILCEQ